ncbi:phage baseplate assembly protein V [Caproicibacter sp.]|uniref:phage baseplate assembly protein V n=1 Tax=Caproicibacter sp. TaxID=2814884 RepID=UPI00398A182A
MDPFAPESEKIYEFLPATVLANNDEEHKGLLKVELICEGTDRAVLDGVKVVVPFSGDAYGIYALPEIGEQVVVGFLNGSFDRPFVLGSLCTVKDRMLSDSYHETNAYKRIVTAGGNLIEISDEKGEESISVKTPKKISMIFSEKDGTAAISAGENQVKISDADGTAEISAKEKILLKTGGSSVTMDSDGGITVNGENLQWKASAISAKSSGELTVQGTKTSLSGSMVEISSQGIMTIKGSITKIN